MAKAGQRPDDPRDDRRPPGELTARLRREEAREEGERREEQIHAEAVAIFEASSDYRRLAAGMGNAEAHQILVEGREAALESVEADRAAYREALVEDYETWVRRRGALRGLLPVIAVAGALVYGTIAVFIVAREQTAILVGTVAAAIIGLAREFLETRVREFTTATAARQNSRRDLRAARQLLVRALVEVALPDLLRQALFEQRQSTQASPVPSGETPAGHGAKTLRVEPLDSSNLVESYKSRQQVDTAGRRRILELTADLSSASIGLAGPRGAGKTSLLRWFFELQAAEANYFALRISAPVKYDPRDFVLTLFARMCEDIIGARSVPFFPSQRRLLTSAWSLFGGLFLIVAGFVTYATEVEIHGSPRDYAGISMALMGIGLLVLRFVEVARSAVTGSQALSNSQISTSIPENVAPQLLRDIRFQLTFASGYSGKLTSGFGEIGADASYSLAARQESFPEIVGRFQAFVEAIARDRGRAYIGIDELDKLSATDAIPFLDDIKALFGIPGCFFFISISEDALGQFERRGLPMRDAFDSAFDEVVHIEPLTASESMTLLAGRTENLQPGLAVLCHVIAGGIPRDVVRQGRRLAMRSRNRPTISEAAEALLLQDIRERANGARLALSSDAENRREHEWLDSFATATDPEALLTQARSAPRELRPLGALAYLTATAGQLIEMDTDGSLEALRSEADDLASIRLDLAIRPERAWVKCSEMRASYEMAVLEYPKATEDGKKPVPPVSA